MVDVRRDHRDAGLHGAVDGLVEDLAAGEGHDDAVGLLRDGGLQVVELLLEVAVLLQEDHLAVGLDLGAGLVHALLHRLPEDVRRRRMQKVSEKRSCASALLSPAISPSVAIASTRCLPWSSKSLPVLCRDVPRFVHER